MKRIVKITRVGIKMKLKSSLTFTPYCESQMHAGPPALQNVFFNAFR